MNRESDKLDMALAQAMDAQAIGGLSDTLYYIQRLEHKLNCVLNKLDESRVNQGDDNNG